MIDPFNADDLVVVDDVDNSVRAFVGAVVSSQGPVQLTAHAVRVGCKRAFAEFECRRCDCFR